MARRLDSPPRAAVRTRSVAALDVADIQPAEAWQSQGRSTKRTPEHNSPYRARQSNRLALREGCIPRNEMASTSAGATTKSTREKLDHGFDKVSAANLQKRLKPLIRKTQPYSKRISHKAFGSSRSCSPSSSIGQSRRRAKCGTRFSRDCARTMDRARGRAVGGRTIGENGRLMLSALVAGSVRFEATDVADRQRLSAAGRTTRTRNDPEPRQGTWLAHSAGSRSREPMLGRTKQLSSCPSDRRL